MDKFIVQKSGRTVNTRFHCQCILHKSARLKIELSKRSREGFSTLWLLLITQVDWPSVHQLPQRSDAFPSSTRSTSTCFGSQTTFIGRHCSLSSYPVLWQSFLEMLTRISISH